MHRRQAALWDQAQLNSGAALVTVRLTTEDGPGQVHFEVPRALLWSSPHAAPRPAPD